MRFTDIFVHRPVLATVVSLLILLLGVRSAMEMEIRQYPELESTTVTVTTAYPGASSQLVQGFVTTPLQQAIAEADGIDYLTATSRQGSSIIQAKMDLNYDANDALSEIQAKVASQRNELPEASRDPVIESETGDSTALMYIAFHSESLPVSQITDYLTRVVQPQLQALSGVGKADLFGRTYAMRVWLDPTRLASLDITPREVVDVLRANNYQAAVGSIESDLIRVGLDADTDIADPEQFRRLVVREVDGTLIRLEDIADVALGAENNDQISYYAGSPATYLAIELAPGANPLDVADRVRSELPGIESQLPSGLNVDLPYDASEFIEDSINEVIYTLVEALIIVLVVIFLCLGSIRAAVVPSVAVPLSMIGGAFLMLLMGFSVNLLTLLAMVLAIGLVVDDAIIMVENVHRHVERGEKRFDAAINGAREMAVPIIAMTTTLVAVFAPIGFMGGLVGALFTEFAFALAATVVISGVVALTLSPVLSANVLKPAGESGRFERMAESFFERLSNAYRRALTSVVSSLPVIAYFGVAILVAIYFMVTFSQSELAPDEDQGIVFYQGTGPQTANLDYLERYGAEMQERFETLPGYEESFMLMGATAPNEVFGGFKLKPSSEREISQFEVQPMLQEEMDRVTGLRVATFPRPPLPASGGGLPFQFVLTTGSDFEQLNEVADEMLQEANQSGNFIFLEKSIDYNRPVTGISVDRERVADLGLSMADVGETLSTMLGEGFVNRFNMEGRAYDVIPQVSRPFRSDQEKLRDYYVRSASGQLVSLDQVIDFEQRVEPSSRTQFNQLNSITLQGVPMPGTAMGDVMAYMENLAGETLPQGFGTDYKGQSRQLAQQGSALMMTFFLSLLVIYLVLAAQFESWRDPFIILVSVPLSVAGAMIFIVLGVATMNIYTQVGLITLIGVVAKNGILIVEFANLLQKDRGMSVREAAIEASAIRLRPIIMTSLALIVAMVPLLLASGPGAVSRFAIGLTVATGLGFGTFFTLFVLPGFYIMLARDHNAPTRAEAAS
ncbi:MULTISPECIES: efflux RND transporter permease subunit [Gammaproteobacteria]|uniref:Multidrug efflux protein n=2 Tax=Halomonadaceae TaxID=28256 RepID=A0A2A2F5K0_9GAMM|nr:MULTISPECIES: efflux RND transporter permease subunit [Gammaproteobacteria]KAA8980740.1 MMPL family transporter [Halospina sp. K52047b]MYL26599.1 MMPL family transporter [Halomonas utahensis]MYL73936.1 MMPL family transporter [Halomonas sp. 22501_18_FS]PAU79882.1 multidrug efflux protein [Halovibrio salipaludis]